MKFYFNFNFRLGLTLNFNFSFNFKLVKFPVKINSKRVKKNKTSYLSKTLFLFFLIYNKQGVSTHCDFGDTTNISLIIMIIENHYFFFHFVVLLFVYISSS